MASADSGEPSVVRTSFGIIAARSWGWNHSAATWVGENPGFAETSPGPRERRRDGATDQRHRGNSDVGHRSGQHHQPRRPTVRPEQPVHRYVDVVVVAGIGAVAMLAWLHVFEELNKLLWDNDFVAANRWMFPVICLPFSLLVGLLVKYRHAPTTLDEWMPLRRFLENRLAEAPRPTS